MKHKDENHILFNVQKLFPRQNVPDAIEIFLIQRVRNHSDQKKWVTLGQVKTTTEITIQPNGHIREYVGRSICEKLITHINEEYWLIALWNLLYEDSKHSVISREIVRAFIKHCISEIANGLVQYGPNNIEKSHINNECLPDHVRFYKSIFSYNSIIEEMRSRARNKMLSKYKPNNKLLNPDISINIDALIDLFDSFKQEKYLELIQTIKDEKKDDDRRYAVNAFSRIYLLASKFMHRKSQINKALMKLIEES